MSHNDGAFQSITTASYVEVKIHAYLNAVLGLGWWRVFNTVVVYSQGQQIYILTCSIQSPLFV